MPVTLACEAVPGFPCLRNCVPAPACVRPHLRVLADGHEVDVVVLGLVARDALARPHVGVQVQGLAEREVQRAVALADRGGEGACRRRAATAAATRTRSRTAPSGGQERRSTVGNGRRGRGTPARNVHTRTCCEPPGVSAANDAPANTSNMATPRYRAEAVSLETAERAA